MAYNLIWSPAAKFDLKSILDFIAEDSPSVSKQVIQNIINYVEKLPDFPELGRVVPEFSDPTIREIIRKPFRIVYRVNNERQDIEIIRIWHAARGIPDI